MNNRMKQERSEHALWDASGQEFLDCHCSKGIGLMRKQKPFGNSNRLARFILSCHQQEKRLRVKKQRRSGYLIDE